MISYVYNSGIYIDRKKGIISLVDSLFRDLTNIQLKALQEPIR